MKESDDLFIVDNAILRQLYGDTVKVNVGGVTFNIDITAEERERLIAFTHKD